MDKARDYLSQDGGSGLIASLLHLLSGAFGGGSGSGGTGLGHAYRSWLAWQWKTPGQRRSEAYEAERARRRAAVAATEAERPDAVAGLAALLFLPEWRVRELAERWPPLLCVAPTDAMQRLLALKQLLPWHDIPEMVAAHPPLLGADAAFVRTRLAQRLQLLVEGMPGADLSAMIQSCPWVLLEEVEVALPQLHELWPGLDAEAFAASDPGELALAIKALSPSWGRRQGDLLQC